MCVFFRTIFRVTIKVNHTHNTKILYFSRVIFSRRASLTRLVFLIPLDLVPAIRREGCKIIQSSVNCFAPSVGEKDKSHSSVVIR